MIYELKIEPPAPYILTFTQLSVPQTLMPRGGRADRLMRLSGSEAVGMVGLGCVVYASAIYSVSIYRYEKKSKHGERGNRGSRGEMGMTGMTI